MMYLFRATNVVDIFFAISGFLIATMLVKEYQKSTSERWYLRIDAIRFLLRRWFRLLPAYLFAIALFSLRWRFASETTDDYNQARFCKQVWWNLLMVNNNMEGCLGWCWTIAIEFQFYMLSVPVVLICMKKWRVGLFVVALLNIFQIGFVYFTNHELVQDMSTFYNNSFLMLYMPAYTRWNPYLIGLVAGMMYMRHLERKNAVLDDDEEVKPKPASLTSNLLLYLGHVLALVAIFAMPHLEYKRDITIFALEMFEAFSRTFYGMGIAYIVYQCCIGNMKPVNYILSAKVFYYISQVTYSGYLLHPLFREVIYVLDFTAIGIGYHMFLFVALLGVPFVILIGLPVYLLIEKPFVNLRPI
jgi:peptidoglycan/LPS O-acetylase OafA/YrhL